MSTIANTLGVGSGIDTKVLVLTTFDLDEYAFAALKAGASGFMLKDARPGELLNAIRNVAAGDAAVACVDLVDEGEAVVEVAHV